MSERVNLHALIELRDKQRVSRAESTVVKGADQDIDDTKVGKLRWLMHPECELPVKTLVMYELKMDPGAETEPLMHPGGQFVYVVRGSGRSTIAEHTIDWKPGDMLLVPVRKHGVEIVHRNRGDDEALLLCCEPNMADSLGIDRGSSFGPL